ncbi:MAG: glycine/betaine ABC transporter [Clostridia bacterium]|jgi:glycine betaine/proline transport system substrate-binding protein|nr:glycine/betaine ABC transporter [Clostridia bacterium]
MRKNWSVALILVLALSLLVTGCTQNEKSQGEEQSVVERFNGKIIGIEPGAGVMLAAENAIETYGLTEYTLVEGSSATMAAALGDAIRNEEWIAVTGWTPHWMFARWDLKYLEDPEGVFGEAEEIHTLTRVGLKEDMPEVYAFLDNFQWPLEKMQEVMVWNSEEGADPYQSALRFIEENEELVNSWIPEEAAAEKGKVRIIYVEWDSEIASSHVVQAVLQEKMGYNVELMAVDAGPMYQGLAAGDADATVASWLPATHGHYLKQFQDKLVDLGPSVEGAAIGLVVPSYVTIDSIADMQ